MTARQSGDMRSGDTQEYTSARTKVLSVWNLTTDNYLVARPYEWMLKKHNEGVISGESGEPLYFSVGPPGGIRDSLSLKIYPKSDAAYELEVNMINPQEDLHADDDEFLAPYHPIYLRALALAIRERGEDEGEQYSDVMRSYEQALGSAMAYEQEHRHVGLGGGDWIVHGDF
jgi:hypothetical protein